MNSWYGWIEKGFAVIDQKRQYRRELTEEEGEYLLQLMRDHPEIILKEYEDGTVTIDIDKLEEING